MKKLSELGERKAIRLISKLLSDGNIAFIRMPRNCPINDMMTFKNLINVIIDGWIKDKEDNK